MKSADIHEILGTLRTLEAAYPSVNWTYTPSTEVFEGDKDDVWFLVKQNAEKRWFASCRYTAESEVDMDSPGPDEPFWKLEVRGHSLLNVHTDAVAAIVDARDAVLRELNAATDTIAGLFE